MSATGGQGHETPAVACRALATALATRTDEIIGRWEAIVGQRPVAQPLPEPALRDNLPKILGRLSDVVATGDLASALANDGSQLHALDRLSRGFLLGDLVSEYAVLRQCVMDVVADTPGCDVSHVRLVDRVLDHAIETAVSTYAEANQRVLSAVDRLSREALGSWSLDELLSRLLTVIMESTAATDTATILLREGDRLRVRAAVGLVAERDAGFSVAIGEGFAGTIAATREPMMLRDASTDPLVKSEFIRTRQVRALYGVPLSDGEELIGVAHMGSLTAYGFAQADTLLFRAIAQRAAALITEMRLRQRLDEESRLLNAVVQQVPAGVLVAGSDGRIRTSNRAVATIWRGPFTPGTVEDYRIGQVFDLDGRVVPTSEYPLTVALRERRETTRELRITRGDGTQGFLLSSAAPVLDERGQLLAAVVAFVEITELKETQHRLEREAEFRERFLGVLGHDLRNPLAAILLAARRLEARAELPAGVTSTVSRIASSASRMRRMIDELLDFVRARAGGQLPLNPAPTDLRQVLEQVVAEAELGGASGRVTVATSGDVTGVWDPDRLVQMVDNLVRNALRYGAPDRPVRIEAAGDGDTVTVAVVNEGAGIPPERMEGLFEPFARGQDQNGEGLGLGLFIVRAVAASHGGMVDVASSGGETRFVVSLPRHPTTG
ncbi:MAG TPA: ATP-binding protein [Polyangia bacterium]|nr:ATP-binding protein [Polyangia bacterium]